jgi:protein gp37
MNKTEINWTELSWNPVSGCTPVSAGCKYCYARRIAEPKRGTPAFPNGFDIQLRPHKLDEPKRIKRPSLIFTNSMSDFFHPEIPDEYRDRMVGAMLAAPQHRYQVLTKRPEVAERYCASRKLPDCMWLGVTVEHQKTADRIDTLRHIRAHVRFISAEPLIGELDLRGRLEGIHWVIVGGESGPQLTDPAVCAARGLVRRGIREKGEGCWVPRESRLHWARNIRDACAAAGVAFWFKQHGGTKGLMAGRLLDGEEYNGMPWHIPGAMPSADYQHRQRQLALVG